MVEPLGARVIGFVELDARLKTRWQEAAFARDLKRKSGFQSVSESELGVEKLSRALDFGHVFEVLYKATGEMTLTGRVGPVVKVVLDRARALGNSMFGWLRMRNFVVE